MAGAQGGGPSSPRAESSSGGRAVSRALRSQYTRTVKDAGGVAKVLLPDTWVLLFLPDSRYCISQSDVFGWELCDYMGEVWCPQGIYSS